MFIASSDKLTGTLFVHCIAPGVDGSDGIAGPPGPSGPPGPPSTSGGTTYVRWGRTVCPDINGTELVYDGLTAGSAYNHGGGANYICTAKGTDAEYHSEATTRNANSAICMVQNMKSQVGKHFLM